MRCATTPKESSRTAWEELRLRFRECPERKGNSDFAQKFGCAANMSLAAHPTFMRHASRKISRKVFEELGQGGDDVGGEGFVIVLLFPFFAFEPNGLCTEGVGGDDVFGERIANGHTR